MIKISNLAPLNHGEKSYTVCLFSNETKDDGINPKRIEIIKFRKKVPERVCSGNCLYQILALDLN